MKSNEEVEIESNIPKGPFLGIRHVQVALIFLNFVVVSMSRTHVAISLVIMTNADESNVDFPAYNWNEQQKSYILSSFYWGYVVMQFPGAYFARRFGVKIVLFISTMTTGLITLLIPFCVTWGDWQAFCLLRFLNGLFQGGFFPAVTQHLTKWSPPKERDLLSSISYTGYDCGIVVAMFFSGVIAISSLGWPGIFYVYAAICFVWCALWQLFGANNATESRYITAEELLYIKDSLKKSVSFEKHLPVPWRAICTSKQFYAVVISRSITLASVFIIQTEWPSYVNGVLKLNIKATSVYSALPFISSWISTYIFSFIANWITKQNFLSLTKIRKCFDAIGTWGPAIGIIVIGFLDETYKVLSIIIMVLVVGLHSSQLMGSTLSSVEIAPNHTGIIASVISTIANCLHLLAPLIVGIIVDNVQDREQWQIVFAIIAVIICIGDLVYLIWGTSEEQAWNAIDYADVKTNTKPGR